MSLQQLRFKLTNKRLEHKRLKRENRDRLTERKLPVTQVQYINSINTRQRTIKITLASKLDYTKRLQQSNKSQNPNRTKS